jgi:hypothetical protein
MPSGKTANGSKESRHRPSAVRSGSRPQSQEQPIHIREAYSRSSACRLASTAPRAPTVRTPSQYLESRHCHLWQIPKTHRLASQRVSVLVASTKARYKLSVFSNISSRSLEPRPDATRKDPNGRPGREDRENPKQEYHFCQERRLPAHPNGVEVFYGLRDQHSRVIPEKLKKAAIVDF